MAGNRDYIPSNDAEFDQWFANLVDYVDRKTAGATPAWDHIPRRHVQELDAAYDDWFLYYQPTKLPHTPAQNQAKNDARKRAEAVIRPFVRRFLHFEPVTNAERVDMRIPLHDKVRTDHVLVPEEVEFNLVIEGIRVVHVSFKVLGAPHDAKPEGYDGAVVVWYIDETGEGAPEGGPHDFPEHTMASRTPHIIPFTEAQRGKTVYVACAWQNERGFLGRWSDVKSTVIP